MLDIFIATLRKRFGGGLMMMDLMMAATKVTYEAAWEEKTLQLKQLNNDAYNWLVQSVMFSLT